MNELNSTYVFAYTLAVALMLGIFGVMLCGNKLFYHIRYRDHKCEHCTAQILERRGRRYFLREKPDSPIISSICCRVRYTVDGRTYEKWISQSPRNGDTAEIKYRPENPKRCLLSGSGEIKHPVLVGLIFFASLLLILFGMLLIALLALL